MKSYTIQITDKVKGERPVLLQLGRHRLQFSEDARQHEVQLTEEEADQLERDGYELLTHAVGQPWPEGHADSPAVDPAALPEETIVRALDAETLAELEGSVAPLFVPNSKKQKPGRRPEEA